MGQLAWCIQQQTKDTVSNKVEGEKGHPRLSSALYTRATAHTDLHRHAQNFKKKIGKPLSEPGLLVYAKQEG